ncbi:hypothetical protein PybrP1_012199 [[Pythium] brassicae (nom. inval.)]|nr:hypothetical protein PybrP1_012199 [[Pythium] brassicae (nom. inval.)]
MLTVQQLAESVPQEALGVALATAVAYFALRAFFNVDRVLKRLYPAVLLAGAYYRYHALAADQTQSERSLLLEALQSLRAKAPHAETALGDLAVVALALHVAVAVLDALRKSRYVSKKNVLNVVGGTAVAVLKKIPFAAGKLAGEIKKIEEQIEHSLKAESQHLGKVYELPAKGMADAALVALLQTLAGDADKRWQDGLVSGAVYHGEQDHLAVLNKAYELFSVSNPLHADLWPAVGKFEAEVIAMTANLMSHGSADVCGTLSSGGTESIFLAAKTHREFYRHKHGITQPEIIACVTAHAAIDKACEVLGIKLIKVPVDPVTLKSDVAAVKWNITANTIMIYSSAPNFPHGIIDDIEALSKVAVANDVGLHVDCCLGGFILPFAKKLRATIPTFDFELPGVTSMSCDTHKYGYAAKGTSVVLYKSKELRRFQYFAYPDWTGGLYVTPTLAGSRPGALSAAADAMAKKGWSLNALQHPVSVHLCVTVRHIGKAKNMPAGPVDDILRIYTDVTLKV